MHESNWQQRITLGIAAVSLLGVVFVGLFLWKAFDNCKSIAELAQTHYQEEYRAAQIQCSEQRDIAIANAKLFLFAKIGDDEAHVDHQRCIDEVSYKFLEPSVSLDLCAQTYMGYGTIWIVIFTGVGIVLLLLTLREAQGTTSAAANAAETQEVATYFSSKAYIRFERPKVSFDPKRQVIKVIPVFKNIGHTPACDLNCDSYRQVLDIDADDTPSYLLKELGLDEADTIMADQWFYGDPIEFSMREFRSSKKGKVRLYMFFRIFFDDVFVGIFDRSKRQEIIFSYQLTADGPLPRRKSDNVLFNYRPANKYRLKNQDNHQQDTE